MFLWFHCFKGGGGSCRRQGKSAAPWRGEAMFCESVRHGCLGFVFPFRKYRCILMIYRKKGPGLKGPWFPSPLFRGGPGGARTL